MLEKKSGTGLVPSVQSQINRMWFLWTLSPNSFVPLLWAKPQQSVTLVPLLWAGICVFSRTGIVNSKEEILPSAPLAAGENVSPKSLKGYADKFLQAFIPQQNNQGTMYGMRKQACPCLKRATCLIWMPLRISCA